MPLVVEDDGMDYMGHGRKAPESWVEDRGCACVLGKMARHPLPISPMCLNCSYYDEKGRCTNRKKLGELSSIFDLGDALTVKNPTNHCSHHELNLAALKPLVTVLEQGYANAAHQPETFSAGVLHFFFFRLWHTPKPVPLGADAPIPRFNFEINNKRHGTNKLMPAFWRAARRQGGWWDEGHAGWIDNRFFVKGGWPL